MFFFVLESAFCDKNMLLVPKYFVPIPDNAPEILINLSHPWTVHLYMPSVNKQAEYKTKWL